MSGGRWNYSQRNMAYEMFPYANVTYGLGKGDYSESVKAARKDNPLEDKELSELLFDLLCVAYSADWYQSGDTSEEQYRADVEFFKQKWLRRKPEAMIEEEIGKSLAEMKEELYRAFGLKEIDNA